MDNNNNYQQQPNPQYQQPNPQYQQANPQYQQPYQQYQPELPMKWFKFLIYFALFAGAVLNVIYGILALTGSQYGDSADLVYSNYPGLKGLDIFYGIMCILMAAFGVVTRFMLSGFKKNGPTFLYAYYGISIVISLIYIIGVNSVVSSQGNVSSASNISSIAVSVAILCANVTYFRKRKHLFVN